LGPKRIVGIIMKKVLVTGGGGFVGKAIVRQLVDRGISCVVVGRNRYNDLEELGVQCLQGDIRDETFVYRSCEGVDTVFHVAALAGIWGRWRDYYSINVKGSENVVNGCRKHNVGSLVYTSTPSVVFSGEDIVDGDESLPYAKRFLCHYARSKVMAEKVILQANNRNLYSCAIRPHLVWGPGDPHLIPRLLKRGRAGKLKMVGSGANLVDISYVDNVAHAHLLAADNLKGVKSCAGKSYFISQGEPVVLWQWINELFDRLGINKVGNGIPLPVAYGLGALLEGVHTLLGKNDEPLMTRFLAEQLGKSHCFSIERAREDLGYQPLVSTEEGMKRLIDWVQSL